jgi:hypothetical protein
MKVLANPVLPLMETRRREQLETEEMKQVTVTVQIVEAIAVNVLIIIMPLEICATSTTNNIVILWMIGAVTGLMDIGIYHHLTMVVDIHQKFTLAIGSLIQEVLITVVVLVLYPVVVVLVLLILQGLKVIETMATADITKEMVVAMVVVVLRIIINKAVEEEVEGITSTIGMEIITDVWMVGVVVIVVIGDDFVFCELVNGFNQGYKFSQVKTYSLLGAVVITATG